MTTTITGTTGVSQCQPNSVSQDDLLDGVVGKGPSFSAAGTAASITYIDGAATAITGIPEIKDTASCYDPVTGRFTPNVAGDYQLNATCNIGGAFTTSFAKLRITASGLTVEGGISPTGSGTDVGFGAGSASTLAFFNGTTDFAFISLNHDSSGNKTGAIVVAFSGFLARAA